MGFTIYRDFKTPLILPIIARCAMLKFKLVFGREFIYFKQTADEQCDFEGLKILKIELSRNSNCHYQKRFRASCRNFKGLGI